MVYAAAERLAERGHTVGIATVETRSTPSKGVEILPIASDDPEQSQPLARWRPDVVHLYDLVEPEFAELGARRASQLGVPLVVTPATDASLWANRDRSMAVCRGAARVLVLSDAEAATLRAGGVAADRLEHMPTATELRGRGDPQAFRSRFGLEGPMVLFCGRMVRFKGYHQLLAATTLVWRSQPDAKFVFIGPRLDNDVSEVFDAHRDSRVTDLGVLSENDKHSALAACDLVCAPSTADVFPLVIAESWMCGKPVVVGPFPGSADIVRDGVDGVVTDGSAVSLAEAIGRLLADPALGAKMGASGKARGCWSWDAVARRLEEVYSTYSKDQRR
jgi:glycosyltransferase involved in cell wall biosynthesis